jgi:predicted nucleic acid-binding protein
MEKELILCDTNIFIAWFRGHGLLIPDAIIAATAISFNLKLFTYNTKDFIFIPGIRLYEY